MMVATREEAKDMMTGRTARKKCSKPSTVVYGTVDRGWAWVIMFALAFWNILIAGALKSFGVIYLEYLDLYQRGPVATAWMGFSFSIVITVMAPLSGYLGDHLSLKVQRILVMCLGVVMATAIAATGWIPKLEGAIITYGMAGFAASLVDTPILSLLGKYFKRRRFLASGVVFAGSSFGTLVLPPIFTLLVEAYAIRGAMVVFGGVWLNVLVVGAVIRPIEEHAISPPRDAHEGLKTPDLRNIKNAESEESDPKVNRDTAKRLLNGNDGLQFEIRHSTLSLGLQPLGINTFIASSRQSLDRKFGDTSLQRHRHSASVPCLPKATTSRNINASLCDMTTPANKHTTCPDANANDSKTCYNEKRKLYNDETNLCDDCKPEALSFSKQLCDILRAYWLFLKTPGLPLLILTFCAGSFAYFNQFFIFPPLAREYGMTKMQGAMLVSVSNVTELMSRLVVGLLVDKGKVKKSYLIKISFTLSAILALIASFFSNHAFVFVYAALFGLLGGVFIPLAIPLMVELVPASEVSSAAGIYVLVTGAGISLGPPVLGAVKALTGTFADSLRLCSVFYLVALGFYAINQGNMSCRRHKKLEAIDNCDVISTHDIP
ncbi:hypothetical protein LSH36_67g02052 [Paralvinella palmiformis]|uniref:Major facilitator superfamily (MFS) profile domain-containing protein n=1 Tax=Paralvinella palmiformis TaxID=53620 RepID=A0AAD9K3S2_9ANNE|nr:hypothetical protein LSH36_67g02052 [Paralvinella palmiformis]